MTRFLPGAAAFVAAILVALVGLYANAESPPPAESSGSGNLVKVRLLGVNDLHGHLEAPRPGLGGAAWLKAHMDRATVPGRTIRVHAGEVFVCEDIATNEIDIGLIDRAGRVSKFLSVTGPDHVGSELTGVTFDPSGTRMYFSSQRAFGKDGLPGPGAIYEVSGPFRGSRAFHAKAHSA